MSEHALPSCQHVSHTRHEKCVRARGTATEYVHVPGEDKPKIRDFSSCDAAVCGCHDDAWDALRSDVRTVCCHERYGSKVTVTV